MTIFDTSRRDFLRNLLLGTAALATTGLDLRAQEALAQNKGRKLGVALLGLGKYSSGQLGPALRETNLCYLPGVITGHPEKGAQCAAPYNLNKTNIYSYDNTAHIAPNPNITIVYI